MTTQTETKPRVRKRATTQTFHVPEGVKELDGERFEVTFPRQVNLGSKGMGDKLQCRIPTLGDRMTASTLAGPGADNEEVHAALVATCAELAPDDMDDLQLPQYLYLMQKFTEYTSGEDPAHYWQTLNDDGSYEVRLRYGLDTDGAVTKVVTMQPVTVGMRKKSSKAGNDVEREMKLFELCCNLTRDQIMSMRVWDYARLMETLETFLASPT